MLEKDTMEVRVLANRVAPTSPTHAGMPLIYTNDLDIASDGTVYFTTSINVYPHRCGTPQAGGAGGCCKHTCALEACGVQRCGRCPSGPCSEANS